MYFKIFNYVFIPQNSYVLSLFNSMLSHLFSYVYLVLYALYKHIRRTHHSQMNPPYFICLLAYSSLSIFNFLCLLLSPAESIEYAIDLSTYTLLTLSSYLCSANSLSLSTLECTVSLSTKASSVHTSCCSFNPTSYLNRFDSVHFIRCLLCTYCIDLITQLLSIQCI